MSDGLRVIVCGYIVRGPLGGLAWHHLQYVLGLHRMGHRVTFVEDSDGYASCYDPATSTLSTDPAYGLAFAADAFGRLGLGDVWAYYDEHRSLWCGPLAGQALERFAEADVLLDISGINPPRPWWEGVAARVLIDTDPVFLQLRHIAAGPERSPARTHTAFFTFAGNAGDGAALPDDGLPWRPTRQPVVVDAWPVDEGPADGPWTTVMQWESYDAREHDGVRYGMKAESFRPYADLPARLPAERFELAVGSATAPRETLRERGWGMLDPLEVTRDPWTYQAFVRGSKGEVSVAKHGYVVSASGWFSERTAGYLASGRPAVVQDTGFTRWLEADAGLRAFTTPDEAAAAVEEVGGDYRAHCRAARELAAEVFDHERVLEPLLAEALG